MAADPVPDIRVLIDVSGSMKKNDPKNLRKPALRLLVGLLPKNSRSGVWTFAQYANMQVKAGKVNERWRALARVESSKIHSRGLYTNIEAVLKRATLDWKKHDYRYRRNLILLTDGMVDVSKNAKKNAASRERILKKILPQLKQAGVMIHTIALSKNADNELMQTLSRATDGGFIQVDSADQLEKMFLRLFEKTTDIDSVPITENKFKVDKNIRDYTVLIFRAPGDKKPAAVISPSNKRYSYKKHPKSIVWHHEKNYDLVTVSNPESGEWKLDTSIDPDNRVMVVTNLKLKVGKLPNNLVLGDEMVVRARLLQDSKTITDKKLLQLTRFTVQSNLGDKEIAPIQLLDNGKNKDAFANDGVYSGSIGHYTERGTYELSIAVSGETFNRSIKHLLDVPGGPAKIKETFDKTTGKFRLNVLIEPSMLKQETVSMQLRLPDGKAEIVPQKSAQEWEIALANDYKNSELTLTVVGTRHNGQQYKADLSHTLGLGGEIKTAKVKLPAKVMENSATQASEPKSDNKHGSDEKAQDTEKKHEGDKKPKDKEMDEIGKTDVAAEGGGPDWLNVGGLFAGINAILGLIVLLFVLLFRRRRKRKQAAIEKIDLEL